MQLVAYGAQDIYLTGNPQITFFKIVYRRHTNFSMETIKQNISGQSFIGIDNVNNKATVTISRNGDLVTGVYVLSKAQQIDVNGNIIGICGDNLVEDVEIEIGGQRIDKHYKEWNQVWDELTTPVSKADGYKFMTGGFNNDLVKSSETKQERVCYPLKFWFCRNPGLALPLIALQYHEVQLKFTWGVGMYSSSKNDNLTRSRGLSEQHSVEVWADYIYLDTDERRRFTQVSHEYLIEQLQIQKEKDISSESFKLNLEHPIKEIIWTTPKDNPITDQKIKILINGHDRFYERDKEYFTLEQPYKYHTSIPGYNIKESEHPVLLNKTEFSKIYDYHNFETGENLSNIPDNKFLNYTIDTRTSESSSIIENNKTFLFVSGGSTPNPSMDFKIGDIVRVNYYDYILTQPFLTGVTVGTGSDFEHHNDATATGTSTDKYKLQLFPFQDPNGTGVNAGNYIRTDDDVEDVYESNGDLIDIEGKRYNINHDNDSNTALRDIPSKFVESLAVDGSYEKEYYKNVVRDLTVMSVFKSTTLISGKTVYEIRFNDSITHTSNNSSGDKVSFEIIGRVQNPVSRCSQLKKDIYVYSFCLEPEEHQPSGSCNFSRIDSAKLLFSSDASISNIYAVNYNVLRIISGMGGLAYSS